MVPFELKALTRMFFGTGAVERVGRLAGELGGTASSSSPIPASSRPATPPPSSTLLTEAGLEVFTFDDFGANPDSDDAERGRAFAAPLRVDLIVAVGGGSSLDCAKGINFLLTNGGVMADYRGYGKVKTPLLPMIGVPTTAGTGSEAQSYAVIADAGTHMKMACGDPSAAFRVALLDPVADAERAARRHGDGRLRRDRPRRRDRGHDQAHAAVGRLLAAGLADAVRRLRTRARPPERFRSALDDAGGGVPRRAWRSSTRCWAPRTPAPIR